MIATASPFPLGARPQTACDAVAEDTGARAVGSGGVVDVSRRARPWRWRTALADVVALLAVVSSIPLIVLVVGTPIALAIVSLLWAGQWALSAF